MDQPPVSFVDPSLEQPGYKSRRGLRLPVEGQANLRASDLYEVQVRNVSASGFMAECPARLQIGSYVALDIPGIGPVRAQVRWQLGAAIGGMFLDPISLVRCEWTGVKRPDGAGSPVRA